MLSSNSSLQNGRFRVIGLFGEADGGRLYDAFDDQLGQKLVIHESPASDDFSERLNALKNRRINGVVQIRDGFVEGENAYLVTEALDGRASADEFLNDPANSIGMLLSGLSSLMTHDGSVYLTDINPQMIRRAQDGNNSLLNFASGSPSSEQRNTHKLTPFAALETVWPGLDIVTQKALLNACDDDAIADIESPADERTAVFSLASSIYQIIAGKAPLDVLVRSIELLDEKGDPLKTLSELRPSIDASLSAAISNMMALKRSDRPSVADAISSLGSIKPRKSEAVELDLDDELDLLEIPIETSSAPSFVEPTPTAPEPVIQPTVSRPEPVIPTFTAKIEEKAEKAFEPTFKTKSEDAVPSFAMDAPARSSGAGVKVAAAAAGLVVVAVIGWFALGSGDGANAAASTAPPARTVEPVASSEQVPSAVPATANEPTTTQTEPASNSPTDQQPKLDESKQPKRPVVAEVRPQTKPSPAKTEKPKKTVTVDDLIKDN
ncbi:MAG TPA: hypothetical protein PKA82_07465 [Pyrinomonadaceae bacterium]|nr:hypothetical protein [Pyrinomonadaceae bacterium]